MNTKELEAKVLNKKKIKFEDVAKIVPIDSIKTLEEVHELFKGNTRQTAYAALISQFYEPSEQALNVIKRAILPYKKGHEEGQEMLSEGHYRLLRTGYARRTAMKNPSPAYLLEVELIPDGSRMFGKPTEGKVGPGPYDIHNTGHSKDLDLS